MPRLGPEALERLRILGVFRAQQLDRDRAPQHPVLGSPYLAHSPFGDPPLQQVAVTENNAP